MNYLLQHSCAARTANERVAILYKVGEQIRTYCNDVRMFACTNTHLLHVLACSVQYLLLLALFNTCFWASTAASSYLPRPPEAATSGPHSCFVAFAA